MKGYSPLTRAALILCGIAFLASEVMLQTIIWPRWGPTAAVLAGFVPLAIFGWIMKSIKRDSTLVDEPQKQNSRGAILKPIFVVAWLVAMISWFPMAEIETAVLKQPDHPTAQFTQPMHLKGVIRYVTPNQASIDNLAHWGFIGGWLIGVSSFLIYRWLERGKRTS